jgi:hypothetical protein
MVESEGRKKTLCRCAASAMRARRGSTSSSRTRARSRGSDPACGGGRPSPGAWIQLPNKYVPKVGAAGELHRALNQLRKKVYAHSDKESGRSASMKTVATSAGIETISYGSSWWAFRVENLHAVQALCHDQRQRFLKDAAAIHVELEAADAGV